MVDWAGSHLQGCAFFELVRAADSRGGSPRRLRIEVERHCALLGCKPVDAAACVLAAVGDPRRVSEFRLHRQLGMAEASLARIEGAVAA